MGYFAHRQVLQFLFRILSGFGHFSPSCRVMLSKMGMNNLFLFTFLIYLFCLVKAVLLLFLTGSYFPYLLGIQICVNTSYTFFLLSVLEKFLLGFLCLWSKDEGSFSIPSLKNSSDFSRTRLNNCFHLIVQGVMMTF